MLNAAYIQSSTPVYIRTSQLAQTIRSDLGQYVNAKRKYVSKWAIAATLRRMDYGSKMADALASYVEKCVESAFERGIFVVSSRTITSTQSALPEIRDSKSLIAFFKSREPEHFDPTKWYLLQDFERELKNENYHDDIVQELSRFILLHVRAAFAVGMNSAANKVTFKINHVNHTVLS